MFSNDPSAVRRRTALIAEDDERVARMLGDTLRLIGFQPHVVHDGLEAMQSIADLKPDVVVLDLVLPRRHAQEICASIRQNPALQRMPIIIISGWARQEDQENVFRMGASDFLVKPFHPDQLVSSINALFGAGDHPERLVLQE